MSADTDAIDRALDPLQVSLGADGYALRVLSVENGALSLIVDLVDPAACADCLVPEAVMSDIVLAALPASAGISSVAIEFPPDEYST